MTAETPGHDSCGCPETDGKTYHQRGTCTDPVVDALDWYAAGHPKPAVTPGPADPWRVIGELRSILFQGGQTAQFVRGQAIGVLEAHGITWNAELPAAQDARPARADEFARVKVKLCALVDSLDKTAGHGGVHAEEFDQGAAHASAVTARQLRAILDETALGAAKDVQPAPAFRMILGPCPVHTGTAHAQIGDDDEWFCLRDLADTAESASADNGIVIDVAPPPGVTVNGIPLEDL